MRLPRDACQIERIQVSLAIRGGYVPDKFQTENTQTNILGLNQPNKSSFPSLFTVFKAVNSQNRKPVVKSYLN